jgi:hypothetical protein
MMNDGWVNNRYFDVNGQRSVVLIFNFVLIEISMIDK